MGKAAWPFPSGGMNELLSLQGYQEASQFITNLAGQQHEDGARRLHCIFKPQMKFYLVRVVVLIFPLSHILKIFLFLKNQSGVGAL